MAKPLPPIDELFDRFYVDSTSPSGLRYVDNFGPRARKDGVAGSIGTEGYWKVILFHNGRKVSRKTARIVTALKTGRECPDLEVDHIDRNVANNNPLNLRWIDRSGNNRNRRRQGKYLKGVSFKAHLPKPYFSRIVVAGRRMYLGFFSTELEAHQAYLNALQTYQLS